MWSRQISEGVLARRILFLMSDTGGGHRAAAEAIREALYIRYGRQQVEVNLVDVFKHSLFPLNYMPEFYPWWVNHGKLTWGMGYNMSNTRRRAEALSAWMYLTSGHLLRRMVRQYPADAVVCVHSVITRPTMAAYMTLPERPPFITVVTDLVSTHMFWYEPKAERCLVPTQAAYDRGINCGLRPDQVRLTGLPVNPSFTSGLVEKSAARQKMGWHPTLPVILMVAGGEGMGPLFETAQAIDAVGRKCQLVIIAGKNKPLRERLETARWQHPIKIYGFVDDMPLKMAGADVLVTKAGPATITEASIAGLPMIINDAIPGQETGNVQYVVENNAGVYAANPWRVAEVVSEWLKEGARALESRAENSRKLAHPDAVWQIAEEVWQHAHMPQILVKRRDYLSQILQTPRDMFPNLT